MMKILVPAGKEISIYEKRTKKVIRKKIKKKNATVDLLLWPFVHLKYDFLKRWLGGLITKVKQKDILLDAFWYEFPDIINHIKYFVWKFNKFSIIPDNNIHVLLTLDVPDASPGTVFDKFVSRYNNEISQRLVELEENLKIVRERAHGIMFAKPRTYQRIDYATFLIAQAKKKIKKFEKHVQKQIRSTIGTLEPLEIISAEYVLIPFYVTKTDFETQIFSLRGKEDNFRTEIFRKVITV